MRIPLYLTIVPVLLAAFTACGSPPTKSVRTTTTTTTVDESGAASATARSELRTHVPVTAAPASPLGGASSSSMTTINGPAGDSQTIEQSESDDGQGTTTVRKRVTNY